MPFRKAKSYEFSECGDQYKSSNQAMWMAHFCNYDNYYAIGEKGPGVIETGAGNR